MDPKPRHDTDLEPPFDAYQGDEPFIFVSYAHTDSAQVCPEITRLHKAGYRIWYDEGIIPTKRWRAHIAEALDSCALFLLFISPHAVESHNVVNEIEFALNHRKPILPIYLEDIELPGELELGFGGIQAVMKWKVAEGRYHRLMAMALAEHPGVCAPVPSPVPKPPVSVTTTPARRVTPATVRKLGDTMVGPDRGSLLWVPPGAFDMGTNDGRENEKPVHRVTLPVGFWIGQCQVTNAQYRSFCKDAGREFPKDSDQPSDHPVVSVSWDDACAYCAHYELRLPTEAEWEYAARGPESRTYPWGAEWDAAECCNHENQGPGGKTFEVGYFPEGQSWCGALDLAGNVWEWCQDWYGDYGPDPVSDPPGSAKGDFRVLRGGGWYGDVGDCRSANRYRTNPRNRNDDLGFRVALSKTS